MDAGVKVSIVAAFAKNLTIGRNGDVPWRLKADLTRFKQLTTGHAVIVGRKTHESILRRLGHPLPGRRTIVVSRQVGYQAASCEVAQSFEEALELAGGEQEVFVIGGAEVYKAALPYASKLYLTRVDAFVSGDAYFPSVDITEWDISSREYHDADAENEYPFAFEEYERRSYVYLEHARHDDQRAAMGEIERAGVCPFCPENQGRFPFEPAVWEGKYWVLVPNRWPYEFTKLHLMAVLDRHARMLSELTVEEWAELQTCLAWAEQTYRLDSGAIGVRFGDPAKNGASVDHLHAHLIVADPDVSRPGYERVKFPMGPKPPESKERKTPGS